MNAKELKIQRVAESLRSLIFAINQGAGGSILNTHMLKKAEDALKEYDNQEAANEDEIS